MTFRTATCQQLPKDSTIKVSIYADGHYTILSLVNRIIVDQIETRLIMEISLAQWYLDSSNDVAFKINTRLYSAIFKLILKLISYQPLL